MRVAFLGLGRMGALMARHVLTAGHELVVWNRTPGRAGDLVAAGAREAGSVREAVEGVDVVVTMLFGPDSVREVLEDVVEAAPRGALVVDCTTVGPAAAPVLEALANGGGLRYADAPVLGSVQPAAEGTLGVLVGCHELDWDDVHAVVALWGDEARIRRVGEVGSGSALKAVVNQGIGVLAAGLGEALAEARRHRLPRDVVLDVLTGGPYGWLLQQKGEAIRADRHDDVAWALELLAKDLGLLQQSGPVTAGAMQHALEALGKRRGQDYATLVNAAEGG